MKTIAKALKEGNEGRNQEIKSKFVSIHVQANINSMVEFILRQEDSEAPFNMNDVENFFSFPEYNGQFVNFLGGTEDEKWFALEEAREALEVLEDQLSELDTDLDNKETNDLKEKIADFESEIDELDNLESQPQDVFEWWLVSDFLCEKLAALGHPVIKSENIWGRCTTGQAILLDYAITKICAEMEILEGQTNSWA